jgi:hypothetical protein
MLSLATIAGYQVSLKHSRLGLKFQPVTCLIRPMIGHTFADAAYSYLARPGFEYLCNPTVLTQVLVPKIRERGKVCLFSPLSNN